MNIVNTTVCQCDPFGCVPERVQKETEERERGTINRSLFVRNWRVLQRIWNREHQKKKKKGFFVKSVRCVMHLFSIGYSQFHSNIQ
jgi:hypothetical protein